MKPPTPAAAGRAALPRRALRARAGRRTDAPLASSPDRRVLARGLALALAVVLAFALAGCGDAGTTEVPAAGASTAPPPTRVRVQVQRVRLAKLEGGERVTGTVRAYHRATITAETQGRVLSRAVLPGTAVPEDGLLVLLESSRQTLELRRTEAALANARTVLRHAERELGRGEQLLARNALSTRQHDDFKLAVDRARSELALAEVARDTAKRALEDTKIRAPFAGTVDSLAVDVGDYVAPGTAVATLVDLSRVRIFGGVTAREAARLAPGTKASIGVADLDGRSFEAELVSVARVAAVLDGTYEIELAMENPGGLRDGMVVAIELRDASSAPVLLAPRAALLRRGGQTEVFVVERSGEAPVARLRSVRTGRIAEDSVEIVDGLSEGEEVVFDGHFALKDGSRVVIDGEAAPVGGATAAVATGTAHEAGAPPAARPGAN